MSLEGGQETWVEKERETVWTKSLQRGRERKEMCRWHMNTCTQHTPTHARMRTNASWILSSFQALSLQKAFPLVYWLSLPTFSTSIAVVDEKEKGAGDTAATKACAHLYMRVCLCARSPTFSFTWAISSNTSHNPFQLFSTMTVIISPAFQLAVSITCRSIKR